jgi:hypothetical protein
MVGPDHAAVTTYLIDCTPLAEACAIQCIVLV